MWDDLWSAVRGSLLNINMLYFLIGFVSVGGLGMSGALLARRGALSSGSRYARWAQRLRASIPAIVVSSLTTIAAGIQGGFERVITLALGWDFTPHVYALEGHAAEWFQDTLRHPALDLYLVALYTVGAFLLTLVPFWSLVALGRSRSAMRLAATLAIVWGVGLLGYAFLPVSEVWMTAGEPYHYTHVENVLFQVMPEYAGNPTYMNSANNNMPSLHTGVSMAIVFTLWLARERWLAIPATWAGVSIMAATIYLGIHWWSDLVAGLLLALAAAWIVHRRLPAEESVFNPFRRARESPPPASETDTA